MTIILDQYTLPEKGKVDLKVDRSFEIKVTAEEARRQVNRWLLNEVSYMIGAEAPTLVVGERVVWQVPAWIGFPDVGRVGIVGTVEVDTETGEMNNTAECKAAIERQAEELVTRLPPYRPRTEVPTEYLAKNVPPAPMLVLPDDDEEPVIVPPVSRQAF
jgi:hypothetical protein